MINLKNYSKWTGSKAELLTALKEIENSFPEKFALYSKTHGKRLELKLTRIQRFIELGIIPRPIYRDGKSTKNASYNWHHILHYFAAIRARKLRYSLEDIPSLLNDFSEEQLTTLAISGKISAIHLPNDEAKKIISNKRKINVLRSLDRENGKALVGEQMLIAITPWLHVHVSKKHLHRIKREEAEVICDVLFDNLMSLTSES